MPQESFWHVVDKAIWDAEVVLLVLDARLIDETRNREVEEKVESLDKTLIFVITKADLVDKDSLRKAKRSLGNAVFVSAREHTGLGKLRERILIEGSRAPKRKNRTIRVAVLGYPNVGKSSLINAMKGRASAPTSPSSGFTKGVQRVRADKRVLFLDTPGVIPYNEDDEQKHGIIGSLDSSKIKDPDLAAISLMRKYPGRVERHFSVKPGKDKEETLRRIAVEKHLLKKGGKPDIDRAARLVLKAWQKGEMR